MTIHEKLSLIQQEFKAKKSRFNSFGKYNFRSAEDILEALKPFNKKYNVYFTVNEKYFRHHEVTFLLGDSTKARNTLGWKPRYNFSSLAEDMYLSDFNRTVSEKGWK